MTIATLERGLDVLTVVLEGGGGRIDALAADLGMPVSTTYRYVRTLVRAGFIEASDGGYVAGDQLLRLTRGEDQHEHIVRLAHPLLERLATATEETALLTIRVGTLALCLDRVESPRPVRLSMETGALRSLHAGASAKVLLAYAPEGVVTEVLSADLPRHTTRTPTRDALPRQLHQIRTQGHAVTRGELDPHAIGIAVPVFTSDHIVCALSVAGPSNRLGPAIRRTALGSVQQAARTLAALLQPAPGIGQQVPAVTR